MRPCFESNGMDGYQFGIKQGSLSLSISIALQALFSQRFPDAIWDENVK